MRTLLGRLNADERFTGLGSAVHQEVVDGVLTWQIVISGFEIEPAVREAAAEFAAANGLDLIDGGDGILLLRHAALRPAA